MTWPNRAERRRKYKRRSERIEAPPEIDNKVREQIAVSLCNRRLEFHAGDTVQAVLEREAPQLFDFAKALGFLLSFDLREMTPQALGRGVVAYALKRVPLN